MEMAYSEDKRILNRSYSIFVKEQCKNKEQMNKYLQTNLDIVCGS